MRVSRALGGLVVLCCMLGCHGQPPREPEVPKSSPSEGDDEREAKARRDAMKRRAKEEREVDASGVEAASSAEGRSSGGDATTSTASTPKATSTTQPSGPTPPASPESKLTSGAEPDLVEATPTPPPARAPQLGFKAPAKGQVLSATKALDADVKVDFRGFAVSEKGTRVHLLLDDRPAKVVVDAKQPIKLRDLAPDGLSEGQHVLVALPVHPNGESIKPQGKKGTAGFVSFFVGKREVRWADTAPLIVLNSLRSGTIDADGSVLVDFHVLNTEIADLKMVVHAAVSGPGLAKGLSLTSWRPLRVKGARAGAYLMKLELFRYGASLGESSSSTTVTYQSSKVPGRFAEVTRQLKVEAPSGGR